MANSPPWHHATHPVLRAEEISESLQQMIHTEGRGFSPAVKSDEEKGFSP
jgi:hypothetical protein